jgi:hypothetical protein
MKKEIIAHRFSDTTQFGRDHWSMFAYIECRCVDNQGILNKRHLRLEGRTYPTRLFGYFKDKTNPVLSINNHSDLDCADDLEDVGLIENDGTRFNRVYSLTKYGHKVVAQLRKHKASGGCFANFKEL